MAGERLILEIDLIDQARNKKSMAKQENQTLARIKKRKEQQKGNSSGKPEEIKQPFLRQVRGWTDALFLAFLFAMFIRLFIFELFQIPTGSMTPALIGDAARFITEEDWDGDGQDDIIVSPQSQGLSSLQVHLRNEDGDFERMLVLDQVPPETMNHFLNTNNEGKGRKDMIMVNKFAFWFSGPERGDITVFKVPDRPKQKQGFDVTKPVFIKRVAAGPDEDLILQPIKDAIGRGVGNPDRVTPDSYGGIEIEIVTQPMVVNGEEVTDELYTRLHHLPKQESFLGFPNRETLEISEQNLPADNEFKGFVMLGDNQTGSSDSRYWGRVPFENIRGKAITRYFPIRAFSMLEHGE